MTVTGPRSNGIGVAMGRTSYVEADIAKGPVSVVSLQNHAAGGNAGFLPWSSPEGRRARIRQSLRPSGQWLGRRSVARTKALRGTSQVRLSDLTGVFRLVALRRPWAGLKKKTQVGWRDTFRTGHVAGRIAICQTPKGNRTRFWPGESLAGTNTRAILAQTSGGRSSITKIGHHPAADLPDPVSR